MKLTKEFVEKMNNAGSKEEAKAIWEETKATVEKAGVVLSDDDLDQASGGDWTIDGTTEGGWSSRLHHGEGTDADKQGHSFEGSAGLIRSQTGRYW